MRSPRNTLRLSCALVLVSGCGLGLDPFALVKGDTGDPYDPFSDDPFDDGSGGGSGDGGSGDGGSGDGGSGDGSTDTGLGGSSGGGSSGDGSSGGGSSGGGSSGGGSSGGGSSGGGSGGSTDADADGHAVGADCNDSDADTFPGAAWAESGSTCMTDRDGDGYGATVPAVGATAGSDCVDSNASIFPGATDTPGNGVDEDCSGADASSTWTVTASGSSGPIYDLSTNTFTATVSGCPTIVDLEVTYSLEHSYLGDLDIYLQEPGGLQALLYEGSYDWDYVATTLNETIPITGATVGNGRWTLIVDDTVYIDDGTLYSWSLRMTCR